MKILCLVLASVLFSASIHAQDRGFSNDPKARNAALLVSSAHGLPGLDYDIDNVEKMATHSASGFTVEKLEHGKGTVSQIAKELVRMTDSSDASATFFFYFTGHGGKGTVYAEDRSMRISEIRAALEEGRAQWGPMARLTFVVDSCHSGSLVDPLRSLKPDTFFNSPQVLGQEMVDEIVETLAPKRGEAALYDSLFAFVSAQANETCLAGSKGSAFTVALANAWSRAVEQKYTVEQFIADTQKGTKGSHPVARLVPAELAQEVLVP